MNSETSYSAPVEPATSPSEDISKFRLNRPWYFAAPLAVASDEVLETTLAEHTVSMPKRVLQGAKALGLIDADSNLTSLGETVVELVQAVSTIEDELQWFQSQQGSQCRFIYAAPSLWNDLTGQIISNHSPTQELIKTLTATGRVNLIELADVLIRTDSDLAHAFLREPVTLKSIDSEQARKQYLQSPDAYSGTAIYQYQSLLYHTGVVTKRGRDTSAVVPDQQIWELEGKYSRGDRQ